MVGRILVRARRMFDRRYARLHEFARSRTKWMTAPYAIQTYRDVLAALVDAGFRTPHFSEVHPSGREADLYVRHDIDLVECPRILPSMVEAELKLGIHSGVFFQANDRAPYDLKACRALAGDLAAAGVEVGLHTVCYTEEAPWPALQNEIRRFQEALAMRPATVNAHGLGPYRFRERQAFYAEATPARLRELGFPYSDLSLRLRRYDYIIEDCHVDPGAHIDRSDDPFRILPYSMRYLKDDWLTMPALPGLRCLVLTHPGYWLR